jgi:hypothetical protein
MIAHSYITRAGGAILPGGATHNAFEDAWHMGLVGEADRSGHCRHRFLAQEHCTPRRSSRARDVHSTTVAASTR